jgi:acyl carrier protein
METSMQASTVPDRMQTIFRDVFNEPALQLTDDLTAAEVPGWDSLAHIGLMFSLEAEFTMTFSDNELSLLDNVGQLRQVIQAKMSV